VAEAVCVGTAVRICVAGTTGEEEAGCAPAWVGSEAVAVGGEPIGRR